MGQTTKLTSQYAIYSNCKLDVCEHDLEWINIYKKQLPNEKNININQKLLIPTINKKTIDAFANAYGYSKL